MSYIPHTEHDVEEMLKTIGVSSIEALFDEIPEHLKIKTVDAVPAALNEMQVSRLVTERATKNRCGLCFIGAGAYEHHIPTPVWDLASRGEFITAYTPYQAEASQGTLQVIFEFQSMMASLTGMDVSNASMYEGGSALAEAILMAIRCNRKSKSKKILMPVTVHPLYRETVQTIVITQDVEVIMVPMHETEGTIDLAALEAYEQEDIAAVVIPQPNFFGILDDVDALTNWAHQHNALAIAAVNPLSLAILKEPRQWGEEGADIVCGDVQPFGAPLSSGGPYCGFLTCKAAFMRQMPGRIIGRTTDTEGNEGYVLTIQAREQHIRRAKATSNICSNEALLMTASVIYMSLLGPQGLRKVAEVSHANTHHLLEKVTAISGVKQLFAQPYFHEMVLQLPKPVDQVIAAMNQCGIQAGFNLSTHYPELGNALLVCCTETKTEADLDQYAHCLNKALTGE